jgi:hypothetical protein
MKTRFKSKSLQRFCGDEEPFMSVKNRADYIREMPWNYNPKYGPTFGMITDDLY